MTDPVADRYARTEPLFPEWAAPIYLWVSVAASVIYLGLDLTTVSMPGLALTKALGIILLAVYALLKRAPVLAIALLLSAGGDYALAMRPPQLEAGIGFFGAAHLTYIALFALMVLKGGIKREGLVLAGGLFDGKRVLAVFGADWCPDARRFASVLALPQLKDFLTERYEIVLIDVGRYDKNLDLAAGYGLETVEGAPAIVVADGDGRVVNAGGAYDWRTARTRRPQEFADFLAVYAEAPAP